MPLPSILMPSTLPAFVARPHDITPVAPYADVPTSTGPWRKRRVFVRAPRTLECGLELSEEQMAIFDSWFENDLKAGNEPFTATVAKLGSADLEYWAAKFIEPYDAEPTVYGRWQVQCHLMLSGYSTASTSPPTFETLEAGILVPLTGTAALSVSYGLGAEVLVPLLGEAEANPVIALNSDILVPLIAYTGTSMDTDILVPLEGEAVPETPEGPTWANVEFLMHGDSRPFVDSSENKHGILNLGGRVTLTGSQAAFNGASGCGLKVPADSGWVMGTGAWMIAAYVYTNAALSPEARIIDWRASTLSNDGLAFVVDGSSRPFVEIMGVNYGVGGIGLPTAAVTVPGATRTHVAVSYDGTTLRCFVGGALSWSHVVALNITGLNPIGIGNTPADLANGVASMRVDEVIIVKGEAVYTAAFTPPTRYSDTGIVIEQAAAPTFSNVKLLIHGAGANGGTTITDSSSSARTVSRFGNLQTSTAQAYIGSSSLLFDGTGDYATVPMSSDFAFPGDFCEEVLIRADTVSSIRAVISNYATGNGHGLQTGASNGAAYTGGLQWSAGDLSANRVSSFEALIQVSTWHHVAVCRSGTSLKLFIDGEWVDWVSTALSISSTQALHIGRLSSAVTTRDWDGHMQEIRITKGEAVYNRSFLVQTAAHPDS